MPPEHHHGATVQMCTFTLFTHLVHYCSCVIFFVYRMDVTYVILCFVYSWEEDPFAAAICLVFELARTLYIDGRLANIEWFEL